MFTSRLFTDTGFRYKHYPEHFARINFASVYLFTVLLRKVRYKSSQVMGVK